MIRRPPKYHHYWPHISQMPPLKHSRLGDSEVIKWMCKEFKIDAKLADAVFSSARHAKYVVMYNGHWRGDSLIGFFNWKNGGVQDAKSQKPIKARIQIEEEEPEEPQQPKEPERKLTLEEAKEQFRIVKARLGM
jgi:hypothetical protein